MGWVYNFQIVMYIQVLLYGTRQDSFEEANLGSRGSWQKPF
jgi:hypothetical protein